MSVQYKGVKIGSESKFSVSQEILGLSPRYMICPGEVASYDEAEKLYRVNFLKWLIKEINTKLFDESSVETR